MNIINNEIEEIKNIKLLYSNIKPEIKSRLKEFTDYFQSAGELDIFAELAFCILTPQSNAKVCWQAVLRLKKANLLLSDDIKKLSDTIHPVRFKNNKAKYLSSAKHHFLINNEIRIKPKIISYTDVFQLREWLVENIKGISYKESSHFLRNIGYGKEIAILDRHILRNLVLLGVIEEIPKTINQKKYYEIEKKMKLFSKNISIDLDHLDFVLWYKEAGEVFK